MNVESLYSPWQGEIDEGGGVGGLRFAIKNRLDKGVKYSRLKVENLKDAGHQRATSILNSTSKIIYNSIASMLTTILILAISIFLYGTFYYAYMPLEVHEEPAYLQFDACQNSVGPCSYPNASIELRNKNIRLMAGQRYSISLKLEVPDSTNNQELGMFMSCLHLIGKSNKNLGSSCKSSLLEYKSSLFRIIETFVFSPLLLIGSTSQRQWVNIEYFSGYLDDTLDPTSRAVVELKSRHIQVYSSRLVVHAELSGLRHIMFHHPYICTTAGVLSNVVLLTMIVLISWTRFFTDEDIRMAASASHLGASFSPNSGLTGKVEDSTPAKDQANENSLDDDHNSQASDDILDELKAEARRRMEIQDD